MSVFRETAVVTGAGRGIGKAVTERLARDGYRVVALDRDGDIAARVAGDLRAGGAQAEAIALDVRDRAGARALFERLGGVQVLINNAAIASDMVAFTDLTAARLREMIEINVLGVFAMSQEALRVMGPASRIVNIASRGYLGGAGASHYVASKAAIVGMTRAMAIELRWKEINVNCVAPGMTDTRMMASFSDEMRAKLAQREPRGRAASAAEIADVVAFLASPQAQFVNGQTLLVDGGKTLGMAPL